MNSNKAIRAMGGLALLGLCALGCGGATEVDGVAPRRGEIRESFTEPARTRLAKTYRITMPIAGRIGRIDLEPGDEVQVGQLLADFDRVPLEEAVAEARAGVAELEARIAVKDDNRLEDTALIESVVAVRAASEALNAAEAQVQAEQARSDRAAKELARKKQLARDQAIPETELDDAALEAETSLIELRKQEFYRAAWKAMMVIVNLGPRYVEHYLGLEQLQREVVVHQLIQAQARLRKAEHDLQLASLCSPIDGVVLERYEQGDRTLPAGEPLLLLGNLAELEVVAEVLTEDALHLEPGFEVSLQPAARLEPISGRVERIEPAGFTKLSSLGVEQQRVKVIVSLEGNVDGLGVGYRLQGRFFTGLKPDALIIPRFSVLQDTDGSFYVFKVEGGRVKKHPIQLGLRSDLEIEILDGLSEGDRIVAHPDTTLEDGAKVKVRY